MFTIVKRWQLQGYITFKPANIPCLHSGMRQRCDSHILATPRYAYGAQGMIN